MNTAFDVSSSKKDSISPAKPLVGKWFHSHHEDGSLNWQGQIIDQTKGKLRVQLYEWGFGYLSDKKSVPISDAEGWTLYDSNSQMREAGDAYLASQRYQKQLKPRARCGFSGAGLETFP